MSSVFDDYRVRVAVFVLIAGALGFLVLRMSLGQDAPGSAVPSETGSSSLAPSPADPSDFNSQENPSASPSDTPSNDPSPTPSVTVAEVAKQDVERFFRAFNTFSWLEPPAVFIERAVASGAVPGSDATQSYIRGIVLDSCMASRCSVETTSVSNIKIGKDGTVSANVETLFWNDGQSVKSPLTCTAEIATGPDARKGRFVSAFCLGPEG